MTSSIRRFDVRRAASVNAGKAAGLASRLFGRGGGTALPGLVAHLLDPDILRSLAGELSGGAILVAGTNGKTTTARMLGSICLKAGLTPVRNAAGSNLVRGIATSLIEQSGSDGNLPRAVGAMGIFEVDEAALPSVLREVEPRLLLLLDLFRDQLDRYGEVATVARLWSNALPSLPPGARLVANADDPLVAEVAMASGIETVYFGIDEGQAGSTDPDHASDAKACPRCGGRLVYDHVSYGHLGHYACQSCAMVRPIPTVVARQIELHGAKGSTFVIATPEGTVEIRLDLPGLYNVYNALAAACASWSMDINLGEIAGGLATVTPAFGRMESFPVEGRTVCLALAKNPTGLNEVLRTIASEGPQLNLLVMLNDLAADGHDVSWIWDADIELLKGQVGHVEFSGLRAEDMALRFKYAGVIGEEDVSWEIQRSTENAVRAALSSTSPGKTLYIIPTYTALLDVRARLQRMGSARPYWEIS